VAGIWAEASEHSLDGFTDREQPLAVVEDVLDSSPDSAEHLHNQTGLLGREAHCSSLHSQLLLGIVIEVLGSRIGFDILDDVQDDGEG